MKLNLGSGDLMLPDYNNLDASRGDSIYPLAVPDASCDEIRASHVLEHFPHRQSAAVIADWARALKPGGQMKIAVPDFEHIAKAYLAKHPEPTQGYVMGGQVDERDHHNAIFDQDTLAHLMRAAGLVAINRWKSDAQDCAALPVSLNLCGWKRPARWPKVSALMSVPRLGFMDNFFCAFDALIPFRILIRKTTGAFWGQCMQRGMEDLLREEAPEYILTIDYDTVFDRQDIEDMLALMAAHPEVDALAPLQASRSKATPLLCVRGEDGRGLPQLPVDYFDAPCATAHTAHFGCTLIRAAALADLPKPWFCPKPAPDGGWGEGRIDDDIWFWHQFVSAGKRLAVASRVAVGHLELMVRWPDAHLQAIYQHHSEYAENGRPEGTWQ